VAVIALAGGIWLLRNLILAGNPVFNYKVSPFGITLFDAPPDVVRAQVGFTLAHYLGDPGVLRRFVWPVFRTDSGVAGGLVGVAALASGGMAVVSAARRGRRLEIDPLVPMLAVASVLLALAYLITPYSALGTAGAPVLVAANTRYGVPALLVAVPLLLARGTSRPRSDRTRSRHAGRRRTRGRGTMSPGAGDIVLAAILLAVAAAALRWLPPILRRRSRRPRSAMAGQPPRQPAPRRVWHTTTNGCWPRTRMRLTTRRSTTSSPHAPAHARIALAGTWTPVGLVPVAPLFGPAFRNQVRYVGPFVRHVRRQYQTAAASTRP
jgi:hypothetical protein